MKSVDHTKYTVHKKETHDKNINIDSRNVA